MIKLTDILNELGINANKGLNKDWIKRNINEIIEIIDPGYINNDNPIDDPIGITEEGDEYLEKKDNFKYFIVYNELGDCNCICITDDLDPDIFEGDGPVSSGYKYNLKGIEFQVQYIAC